jgi:hypothetical protein
VPPWNLVNRVIKHCLACGALGTLVVPKWESSPFWPLIFHSNSDFHSNADIQFYSPSGHNTSKKSSENKY